MAGVHGEHLYGQVDRVAGLFYVSTQFWHLNYVPIVPLRSYIVLDGSEDGDTFRGKKIPLQWKSVVIGYLRGWLGAATMFTALYSAFVGTSFFIGHTEWYAIAAALAVAAGLCWCLWFVMTTPRRIFLWVEAALLMVSVALWIGCNWALEQDPALAQAKKNEVAFLPTLLVCNAALLAFNFTRLLTSGTYVRALALAEELGIAQEVIVAHFEPALAELRESSSLPPEPEREIR
jgi:hypothetical protein